MIPIAAIGAPFALGGFRLGGLPASRVGVRSTAGRQSMAALRARVEAHGVRIRLQVPALIQREMTVAVKRVKVRSPVRTGALRDDWQTEGKGWQIALVGGTREPPASYALYAHKKGERGTTFHRKYVIPEVVRARARIQRQLRQLLRDVARPVPPGPSRVPGGRMR